MESSLRIGTLGLPENRGSMGMERSLRMESSLGMESSLEMGTVCAGLGAVAQSRPGSAVQLDLQFTCIRRDQLIQLGFPCPKTMAGPSGSGTSPTGQAPLLGEFALEPVNSSRAGHLEIVNHHFILSVLLWSTQGFKHLPQTPPKAQVDVAVRQEQGLSPRPLGLGTFLAFPGVRAGLS